MRERIAICLCASALLMTACAGSPKSTAPENHTPSDTLSRATVPATLSGTSSPTSTAAPVSGTQVKGYDPFTSSGLLEPGLVVTATRDATCQPAGVAGNSSYRCFAQNSIYDPCFAPGGATSGPVYCPVSPVRDAVVELTVGPLPGPLAGAPLYRAWAFELRGGQVCELVNAAWGGLGPFSCQSPGSEADCHSPVQSSPWWSAECQPQEGEASSFSEYQVDTVWM
ncbi:MAG TPA: hypothetical protein VL961_01805 [Acidimicrobiales bacterium]|nr:hypothetical protein [Acidimicrobiales bacterium]